MTQFVLATSDGDELIKQLDTIIRFVVKADIPMMAETEREILVGHLVGAVFVSVVRIHPVQPGTATNDPPEE